MAEGNARRATGETNMNARQHGWAAQNFHNSHQPSRNGAENAWQLVAWRLLVGFRVWCVGPLQQQQCKSSAQ
eukprot:1792024-Amphidinium_carterae.1